MRCAQYSHEVKFNLLVVDMKLLLTLVLLGLAICFTSGQNDTREVLTNSRSQSGSGSAFSGSGSIAGSGSTPSRSGSGSGSVPSGSGSGSGSGPSGSGSGSGSGSPFFGSGSGSGSTPSGSGSISGSGSTPSGSSSGSGSALFGSGSGSGSALSGSGGGSGSPFSGSSGGSGYYPFSGSGSGSGSVSALSGNGSGSGSPFSGSGSGSGSALSGSGSGSGSALSGSGSGSGSPFFGSGSGSGFALSGSGSGSGSALSGSGSGSVFPGFGSGSGTEQPDIQSTTSTELTTTSQPVTTSSTSVLVSADDLTQLQRNNMVTIVFKGLTRQQFVEKVTPIFQQAVIDIVNNYLVNKGAGRLRRQQELFSSQDVYIIEPVVEMASGLEVTIVVGGRKNQSAPIRESNLIPLLESQGSVLATELRDKTGLQTIEFAGARQFRPLSITTAALSAVEEEGLSNGAIAGIVLGTLIATITITLLVVAIAIGVYRNTQKRKKFVLTQTVSRSYGTHTVEGGESDFSSTWQMLERSSSSENGIRDL